MSLQSSPERRPLEYNSSKMARTVADAFGTGWDGGVDEGVELRGAEDTAWQGFGFVERWELGGGIGEDNA